jgi:molybdopterin converting factor small subunit
MKMNESKEIYATVKFFATLRSVAPAKRNITLLRGSTVNTILEMFNIPEETKLIILINGAPHKTRETVVNNGDIIAIFPPLAGG